MYLIGTKKFYFTTLAIVQLLAIIFIVYHKSSMPKHLDKYNRVSFVDSYYTPKPTNVSALKKSINLPITKVRQHFTDFNSSLCYNNGTDLKQMFRTKAVPWKCQCKQNWHGVDCTQSEVIWRALIAYRKKISIKGPRKYSRRLIYYIRTYYYEELEMLEILLGELNDVVDLFVLAENKKKKFQNLFLKQHSDKILFVSAENISQPQIVWNYVEKHIDNLEPGDLVVISNVNEVLNKNALSFLKYYNGWPEPVTFRLRWSVFGFYWMHPTQTVLTSHACTVKYFRQIMKNSLNLNKIRSQGKSLVLGDLNHFGGWFCEYCMDPLEIVQYLTRDPNKVIQWDKMVNGKIDVNFIENLIGNGLYLDGKTELVKVRQYQDLYFMPAYVGKNSKNFQNLLNNFYSKLDYYEQYV